MSLIKYMCPTFEEELDSDTLISRVLDSHHSGEAEIAFFRGLLELIDNQPFNSVVVDSLLKRTPGDPDKWNTFENPDKWDVLKHDSYAVFPYGKEIKACTPLMLITSHKRKYKGESKEYIKRGEVRHFKAIYYEQMLSLFNIKSIDSEPEHVGFLEGQHPENPSDIALQPIIKSIETIASYINRKIDSLDGWREDSFVIIGKSARDDVYLLEEFYKNGQIEFAQLPKMT